MSRTTNQQVVEMAELQGFINDETGVDTSMVTTGSAKEVGCSMSTIDLDGITEEEAGEYYIDECDVERAYEVLKEYVARRNQPEDELFHDESPALYDAEGNFEANLNELVDIQERMAKGMALIDKSNEEISKRFKALPWFGKLYNAWAGKLDSETASRFLSDPRNSNHIAWLNYRKDLWNKWNMLKDESMTIANRHPRLWIEYFNLEKFEFNTYFTSGEVDEEIDNVYIFDANLDIGDELAKSHLAEMEHEDYLINRPLRNNEMVRPRTGGFVPKCKDVTHLYKNKTKNIKVIEKDNYEAFANSIGCDCQYIDGQPVFILI